MGCEREGWAEHDPAYCHPCMMAAARESGRREGYASALGEMAKGCLHSDGRPDCASCVAGAKWREGHAESIRWVDHYLAMPLKDEARAVLVELRRRVATEAEHGKSTSTLMAGAAKKEGT